MLPHEEGRCTNNEPSLYGSLLFEKSVIEWTKFLVACEDLFIKDLKRMTKKCARQQKVLKALLSRQTSVDIVGQLDLLGQRVKCICENKIMGNVK